MSVQAKICGVNSRVALDAAVGGGASHIGLVFYPPSPRSLTADEAAPLARAASGAVGRVGLFVDPSDEDLDRVTGKVPLDLLQLHGHESPDRVAAIRRRTGIAVMKAIPVATAADLDAAAPYFHTVDRLLFDAKPPKDMKNALPGGNALSFDWRLLAGRTWPLPWMLSGGLDPANVAQAIRITGATAVDVSSGVELRPGLKDPARIDAFLSAVRRAG